MQIATSVVHTCLYLLLNDNHTYEWAFRSHKAILLTLDCYNYDTGKYIHTHHVMGLLQTTQILLGRVDLVYFFFFSFKLAPTIEHAGTK